MSISQPAGAVRTLATGSFYDQVLSPEGEPDSHMHVVVNGALAVSLMPNFFG